MGMRREVRWAARSAPVGLAGWHVHGLFVPQCLSLSGTCARYMRVGKDASYQELAVSMYLQRIARVAAIGSDATALAGQGGCAPLTTCCRQPSNKAWEPYRRQCCLCTVAPRDARACTSHRSHGSFPKRRQVHARAMKGTRVMLHAHSRWRPHIAVAACAS